VGGAIDALMNRSLGKFLESRALAIGKTMVGNMAAMALHFQSTLVAFSVEQLSWIRFFNCNFRTRALHG
jgi:hypothetical protein